MNFKKYFSSNFTKITHEYYEIYKKFSKIIENFKKEKKCIKDDNMSMCITKFIELQKTIFNDF